MKELNAITKANHVSFFIKVQTKVKKYDDSNYVFGARRRSTHSSRVISDGRPNIRRYSGCDIYS